MRSTVGTKLLWSAMASLALLAGSEAALAGNLAGQLFRGLTYTLSPNIGRVQNGPNFDNNFFSQRISRDPLTNGMSHEWFRIFGDDSYGNPDTLNLGLLNVQLRQPDGTGFRGAGIYSRIGYNQRLIPSVYWDQRTSARNIQGFAGAAAVSSPLQYTIDLNTGTDNTVLTGQVLFNSSGSINALGFYDIQLAVSNTGTMRNSGLLDNRTEDTSFDIGPVNLSGNIFIDMVVAAMDVIGEQLGAPADAVQGPFTAKGRTADDVLAAVQAGRSISASDFGVLLTSVLSDPQSGRNRRIGASTNGRTAADVGPAAPVNPMPVPEPGTIGLLLLAAAMLRRRRRRG
ncbi:MAG: PEP-CTERM sorting domain-containing protein [Phycisphaerae bacterium]|nr:PEP-CTERM sorting domain-containing protein [Phycisphaerae bacterium]